MSRTRLFLVVTALNLALLLGLSLQALEREAEAACAVLLTPGASCGPQADVGAGETLVAAGPLRALP